MDRTFRRKSVILMFILPALVLYILLVVVSVFWASWYSFFDWRGVGEMNFVGLENYKQLLCHDQSFWTVLSNTLIFTIIQIVLQVFGGLFVAVFLTSIHKGRAGLQTLYYMPVVISSVAICQIFNKLLSVTPTGVVNSILAGINPDWLYLEWISNSNVSLYVAAFVEGYKNLGLYMVIFYAALISVPKELCEAAIIDGATSFRQFISVKLPHIKPVLLTNCILVLNGSLRSFDISYLLTKGGPGNSSELLTTYMYKQAFSSMQYGYGSAVAIVTVVVCLMVGWLFRRLIERRNAE